MDVNLFLSDFAVQLGDPTNATFSASTLQTLMCIAVRTYRRWRSCVRAFASGVLYSDATAGDTVIQTCGGPWTVGQTILIDIGSYMETKTIASIAPGTMRSNWMGNPIAVTLTSALTQNHAAGRRVTMQNPGLTVVNGNAYYELPSDFQQLDQTTFGLATGQQIAVKKVESFYDGVYYYSQLLSGVGWGQSQNFQGLGYGLWVGIPNGPATFNPPQFPANQTAFEVQLGNPPLLNMTPVPQYSAFWQFNYNAAHQPETVPDYDFDAVMDAAVAAALALQANAKSGMFNWKESDTAEMPDLMVKALMKASDDAMRRFDTKIRKRPFAVGA